MPLIAKNTGGADFELCPTGNTQAVCAFVEDVGMQVNEIKGGFNHKCVICWELAERMADGRPFMLSKSYTVSLHEKANLRKDLESWRGKPFSDAELEGFDLEKLVGVNCLVNVIEYKKKDGSAGRKIAGISPKMKGMTNITVINAAPPEWIAKQRDQNEQDAAKHADAEPVVIVDEPKKQAAPLAPQYLQQRNRSAAPQPAPVAEDDSIPF